MAILPDLRAVVLAEPARLARLTLRIQHARPEPSAIALGRLHPHPGGKPPGHGKRRSGPRPQVETDDDVGETVPRVT